jgi:hypothetical protein
VQYPEQVLSTTGGYNTSNVPAWSISAGQLPAGLTFAAGVGDYAYDAIISGTPTATGLFSFTVQAVQTDANFGPPLTATLPLTIFIAGSQLAITTPSLPSGQAGVAYTQAFTASGVDNGDVLVWTVVSGSLPTGLSLSPNGVLSGTPTYSGSYPFGVQVTDTSSFGGVNTATARFTLAIAPPSPITITNNSSLSPGTVGAAYTQQLAATGGVPPYTWSVGSGTLPGGVSLDAAKGLLSGTPARAGSFSFQLTAVDQFGGSGTGIFTIVVAEPLSISTAALLPSGALGAPYSLSFAATGGATPYTWWVLPQPGPLPPGLSLDPHAGLLSGIPTTSGSYQFTVQVIDVIGRTGTKLFTLNIAATAIKITTNPSLPPGTIGVAYAQQIAATGGTPPYTWTCSSGALPDGLVLNASSGVISGTPTSAGTFNLQLSATDQTGSKATGTFTIVVTVPISITTASPLPAGITGAPYSLLFAAMGGTAPYTWWVLSQTGPLPPGLSLNPQTGRLAGTPTTSGVYQFTVEAIDVSDHTATKVFTLNTSGGITILTQALPGGVVGTAYQNQLQATGGTAPYTWLVLSTAGPLPPGLALDRSTGSLTGTPTASGSYQFLAGVTDTTGSTGSKLLTINIATLLAITTTSPLAGGPIGTPYQLQLAATGGTPPLTWSIASGALPAGLTLDPSTGLISGTPTAGGSFAVTIGVKDAAQSATKAYQLVIALPALPVVTITGLPATAPSATQPAMSISLSAAYTLDLTGVATLTFAPASGSDDPAVQFTTGGRTVDFQIPAGTTQAAFGSSPLGVQTGTVAGTITITLQVLAAGADVTPTPAPTDVIQIAAAPPVITSAKLTASSTGFDLTVIGYATTREVTGATVNLTPASGANLATSAFTIPLTTVFTAWYQDPTSAPYGSQFSLDIPFTVQNAASAISSLTVTLTNSQGASAAANATF